jgi:hypothetical protein
MIKKYFMTAILFLLVMVVIVLSESNGIEAGDACLCTEILSNKTFLTHKDKMPSVKKCIDAFGDFEKAHRQCIEIFSPEPPPIEKNPLKTT